MKKEWLPPLKQYRFFEGKPENKSVNRRKVCFWLWRSAVISANGGVLPCCLYDTEDWGNVLDQTFEQIWNNNNYTRARNLGIDFSDILSGTICDNCNAPFLYN